MYRTSSIRRRPDDFALDPSHPLARGLIFGALGRGRQSLKMWDESGRGNHGTLTNMDPLTDWVFDPYLGRWTTNCDGTDGHIVVGAKPYTAGQIKVSGATWACWFYLDALTGLKYGGLIGGQGASGHGTYSAGGINIGRGSGYTYVGAVIHDGAYKECTTFGSEDLIKRTGWHHLAGFLSVSDAKLYLYFNGVAVGTPPAVTLSGISYDPVVFWMGRYSTRYWWNRLADGLCWARPLCAAEIAALADPSNVMISGLVVPMRRRLIAVGAAAGGITGVLAQTLGAVGIEAAGTVVVKGAASKLLEALGVTAAGGVRVTAAAAKTLDALAASAAGKAVVQAAAAKTLGPLEVAAAGRAITKGVASAALGAVGSTAAGKSLIQAAAAKTLDALAASAAGKVRVSAAAAKVLDALGIQAAGAVHVTVAAALVLDALAASAAGKVIVRAAESGTLDSLAATVTGKALIQAAAAKAIDAIVPTAAARVLVRAAVSKTLSDLGFQATARTVVTGWNPAWGFALLAGQN